MEQALGSNLHGKNKVSIRSGSATLESPEGSAEDGKHIRVSVGKEEVKKEGINGAEAVGQSSGSSHVQTTGDVNMEASIEPDDVARAGGFGARDDIGSFLPVAMDSTDFEASLRDARDYEEPQGNLDRPGIGWPKAVESEER